HIAAEATGPASIIPSPLLVVHAEDLERPLAVGRPVDGRAGEAQVGRIRQRAHQVVAQIPARAAVGKGNGAVQVWDAQNGAACKNVRRVVWFCKSALLPSPRSNAEGFLFLF